MSWAGFVVVGVGAALGAWLRWGFSAALNAVYPVLPLGTLLANLLGGYLMGIAMGFVSSGSLSPEIRLLLTTGFLGGLTTFSTFSAESVSLLSRGDYGWASIHIVMHLVGSLLMTALGLFTVQYLRN
ncbi:MAG TPA: fluoride efflux transporter CrcB [Methylophilaceae bacterium]|jgi:CrcB protein